MKKTLSAVLAAALVAGLGAAVAQAGVITISPQADSYLNKNSPDNNYGSAAVILVRANPAAVYKAYMRFDLSGISNLSQISSATLHLTATNSNGTTLSTWVNQTVSIYGLYDSSWGEGTGPLAGVSDTTGNTITWNHAPSNDTSSSTGFLSPATLIDTFNANGTVGEYAFTSTALANYLKNATAGGTVTLLLNTTGTSGIYMGSRDNGASARRPSLDVTVVPEPATLALLGLGGIATVLRKRR